MPLATCLFNSKRNECVILQDISVETRVKNLKLLEKHSWDIINDDIFIAQLTEFYAQYKILQVYMTNTGGLIEHELLSDDPNFYR